MVVKKRVLWALLTLFLIVSCPALSWGEGNSISPKLGYHFFIWTGDATKADGDAMLEDGEFDGDIDEADFNGWTLELEYDHQFFPIFSLAGSVQWYGGRSEWSAWEEDTHVAGDMSMNVLDFLITPKLHLMIDPVEFTTGAGIGIYWLTLDYQFDIEAPHDSYVESVRDSRTRIGYHLQLGFEYHIQDWFGMFIEDRFSFARFHGKNNVTDFDDIDAGGNSLFLGARFRF